MDELWLRQWVAKKLGQQDVPDIVWQYLERQQYIDDAFNAEGRDSLLKQARELLKIWHNDTERKTVATETKMAIGKGSYFLGTLEKQRAHIISSYMMQQATVRKEVCAFRNIFLNGNILDFDAARRFINSPALQMLPRSVFDNHHIPFVQHTAHILEHLSPNQARIHIEWEGGEHEVIAVRKQVDGMKLVDKVLVFPKQDNGEDISFISVFPDSVLHELKVCGAKLSTDYYWHKGHATWFILTGAQPVVSPLRAGAESRQNTAYYTARINLSIEPCVSPEIVGRFYRHLQKQMLNKTNRPLSQKNMELLSFVLGLDQGLTWQERMEQWNRATENASWRYRSWRHFAQSYRRAHKSILYPNYQIVKAAGIMPVELE